MFVVIGDGTKINRGDNMQLLLFLGLFHPEAFRWGYLSVKDHYGRNTREGAEPSLKDHRGEMQKR